MTNKNVRTINQSQHVPAGEPEYEIGNQNQDY